MREEIRFSGSGGQGLITAARILAKTAILDQKNALQSQTYGAEARGGSTKSEVIIADEKIYFPEVEIPDLVILMTQEAYNKYHAIIHENGNMVIDSFMIKEFNENPKCRIYTKPFTGYAEHEFHSKILANMLITGFVVGLLLEIITIESYSIALEDFFSGEKLEKNILAARFGYDLATKDKPIHFS